MALNIKVVYTSVRRNTSVTEPVQALPYTAQPLGLRRVRAWKPAWSASRDIWD